jgi:predicted regulator of Ras-like GTPase activity (Roadblock/LC7/MglB family)
MEATPAAVTRLIGEFVDRVPGVGDGVLVSADGLPVAASRGLSSDAVDRFAAVASGLTGLAYGAAGRFGGGEVTEIMVAMERVLLFVGGLGDGSLLAVLAEPSADTGQVGYEMGLLAERIGAVLTPEVRTALQTELLG